MSAEGPIIEVGLLSGQAEVKIKCLADSEARVNDKSWKSYKKGQILTVTRSGDQISINGDKTKGTIYLTSKKTEAAFSVKGNSYRGAIEAAAVGLQQRDHGGECRPDGGISPWRGAQ